MPATMTRAALSTIYTTAATGIATLNKPDTDTLTQFGLGGTYGTVTGWYEATTGATDSTGATLWFPVVVKDESAGTVFVTSSSAQITLTDNAVYCHTIRSGGFTGVRFNVGAIASGAVQVTGKSESLIGDSPFFVTTSQTIGATTFSGSITLGAGNNLVLDTATGTKFGTATTQKLAFYNSTPIVQPANTVDYLAGLVNLGLRASGGTAAAAFPGLISSSSATGGIGYATGAGGAVTQATNRTTGVTLNTVCGTITTDTTSLAAGAAAQFTVTNSAVAATDTVVVSIKSGATTTQTTVSVNTVAAGSFKITVNNGHASTAETAAILINFAVIKGVAA